MEFMLAKVYVLSTEMISPNMKRVTFKGVFPNVNFKIGQAIVIRVDDVNYRNYTPSKWDSDLGIFEVIFHIHRKGPGSNFVEKLKINDEIRIGLPRGFNIYKAEEKYHFFFGDESCISVFNSLKDQINKDDKNYLGILEVEDTSVEILNSLGLMIDKVHKSENRGIHAIETLDTLDNAIWDLWKNGFFYLMGNAKSIQNFRTALKEKGISAKKIYTQPYWADGKVGL